MSGTSGPESGQHASSSRDDRRPGVDPRCSFRRLLVRSRAAGALRGAPPGGAVETRAVLEAEIPVVGDPLEQRGRPARFDVMEEIARLTRGAVLAEPSMAEVAQRVRELPPPEPLVSRMRLWAHPALGAIVVALMTLFWIGRKLAGRV